MISFGNIPSNIRVPGVYSEFDSSRALAGLVQNPHKALIIGQKTVVGSAEVETVIPISRSSVADGYFGQGSLLARMCNMFKKNNPYTELYAIALDDADSAIAATGEIDLTAALTGVTALTVSANFNLLVNGVKCYTTLQTGWTIAACNVAIAETINSLPDLPVKATVANEKIAITAKCAGEVGNGIDIRVNYYENEANHPDFVAAATITAMSSGVENPDIADAFALITSERYNYIVSPYTDTSNQVELENELANRFLPQTDQQGHGFMGFRGNLSANSTLGNSRNCPHTTIMGAYSSPTSPEEWAAALGAVCAFHLNNDPARPLHTLKLLGVLAPLTESLFDSSERNILLYDGISTWLVDSGGNVCIERVITTYQENALGSPDPAYLDICTLATLGEIRDQYKIRMSLRFIAPRFKLADDTFLVRPGMKVATPKMVRQEIVSLFFQLRDKGLVENVEELIQNLIVERDIEDRNRVNVLLPPDLVNQFLVLATVIQFIL
ncbi:MAG: phage tail protein [bacterium]|nr:phage tail protein [bacterium]